VTTFPIKKRINTELGAALYVQIWEPELSGEVEEGKMLVPRPANAGPKRTSAKFSM